MATESTVLLVHTHEPPKQLSDELEKQGLFVELAQSADVQRALTVVGPDLLVHCGAAGAAETVAMLAKLPRPRVRLALIVERASIEEMRKLDRSVVTTVLPDDLAEAKLVERVVALANRGTAQASGAAQVSVVPKPSAPKPTSPKPAAAG